VFFFKIENHLNS